MSRPSNSVTPRAWVGISERSSRIKRIIDSLKEKSADILTKSLNNLEEIDLSLYRRADTELILAMFLRDPLYETVEKAKDDIVSNFEIESCNINKIFKSSPLNYIGKCLYKISRDHMCLLLKSLPAGKKKECGKIIVNDRGADFYGIDSEYESIAWAVDDNIGVKRRSYDSSSEDFNPEECLQVLLSAQTPRSASLRPQRSEIALKRMPGFRLLGR